MNNWQNPKSYFLLSGIVLLAALGWWGLGLRHLKVQRSLTLAGQVAGTSTPPVITDPHAQKCFNNFALIAGVTAPGIDPSQLNGLSGGEFLLQTVNAYLLSIGQSQITTANQASLNQILNLYNTTLLGGGATFNFDYASCSGYRSDGPAVDPKGNFTYSYQAQGTSANGAPAWWKTSTGNNGNNGTGNNNSGNNNNGNSGGSGNSRVNSVGLIDGIWPTLDYCRKHRETNCEWWNAPLNSSIVIGNPTQPDGVLCAEHPQTFNVVAGSGLATACVGDKILAYVPTGFKYGEGHTYNGPPIRYELTMTDVVPASIKFPIEMFFGEPADGTMSETVAVFDVVKNGARFTSEDLSDPVDFSHYNKWNTPTNPTDIYTFIVYGQIAPSRVYTDENGKKANFLSYMLRRKRSAANSGDNCNTTGSYPDCSDTAPISSWGPFDQNSVSLPPCDANSCGTSYGNFLCLQSMVATPDIKPGDFVWQRYSAGDVGIGFSDQGIDAVGNLCRYSHDDANGNLQIYNQPAGYISGTCPNGRQFMCSNGTLTEVAGQQCHQDSDCTAPEGSKGYCLAAGYGYLGTNTGFQQNGRCHCGSAKVDTLFGPTVENEVSCLNVQPYFSTDTSGKQQTLSATCGTTLTFGVPGYSSVWLIQTKNGTTKSWDGPYDVPQSYTSVCGKDEGTYKNDVYTLKSGQKDKYLGSVTATILPTQSAGYSPSWISVNNQTCSYRSTNIWNTDKVSLSLTGAPSNTPFSLCSTFSGQGYNGCADNYGTTDASGNWSTITDYGGNQTLNGSWNVYIKLPDGSHSNTLSFALSNPVAGASCAAPANNPPSSPNIVQTVVNTVVSTAQDVWHAITNFFGFK